MDNTTIDKYTVFVRLLGRVTAIHTLARDAKDLDLVRAEVVDTLQSMGVAFKILDIVQGHFSSSDYKELPE